MKSKLLLTTGLLVGMTFSSVQAGWLIPSMTGANMGDGIAIFNPGGHDLLACCSMTLCTCPDDIPAYLSIWIDPLMAVATALDWAATKSHDERTIKSSEAIQKLEEALKGYDESVCWVSLALDDSVAAIYTTENIQAVISVKETKWKNLFKEVRTEVEEYLFETPNGKIKGDCTMTDVECAIERQNEWMLASTTLASATADKVLDKTARGEEETSMKQHFERLRDHFNSKKTPMDMYGAMAEIVLDTHRQMNETNALLGRDLEAQGLRAAHETGATFFPRPDETEE